MLAPEGVILLPNMLRKKVIHDYQRVDIKLPFALNVDRRPERTRSREYHLLYKFFESVRDKYNASMRISRDS